MLVKEKYDWSIGKAKKYIVLNGTKLLKKI